MNNNLENFKLHPDLCQETSINKLISEIINTNKPEAAEKKSILLFNYGKINFKLLD